MKENCRNKVIPGVCLFLLIVTFSHESHARQLPSGMSVISVVKGDSILASRVFDVNEEVAAIVQFKTEALSLAGPSRSKSGTTSISTELSQISAEHTRFRADIASLETGRSKKYPSISTAANTQVAFDYTTAINGVAIRTKRWMLEQIRDFSYVKGISEDGQVRAFDDGSNAVIGADTFWTETGVKGDSIVIGIIDSGIDYFHEALGGGGFPNAKVIGGFDLVNNDPDPMDDNGHGTHVAAIAAGNGPEPVSLRGVAPNAKLMAFKVLGVSGSGTFSQVIAGIERALDPDGDPATPDHVDVINLSLGGTGGPDSPISQAVNNAVASGVVCVVAAGNSGPGSMTVAAPGNATAALTVGAVDNSDVIAGFSSRGPSSLIFDMKPEVVAPGVGITSAKRGGGYIQYSGTSMATPHVAGASALILQLHRGWTPDQVKALLMESARTDGYDVWTEGAGRVDLGRAAQMSGIITPSTLNFGLDDLTQTQWSPSATLTLYNYSAATATYDFSANPLPPGITVAFKPSKLTVPSGGSKTFSVQLTVDNGMVPFPQAPPSYTGTILASPGTPGESISLPFVFTKSARLDLHFDAAPWVAIVHNNEDQYFFLPYPGNAVSLFPPRGVYDVIVRYSGASRQIVRESVPVAATTTLNISKSEARHQVFLSTLDSGGAPVMFDNVGLTLLVNKSSSMGITTAGSISDSTDHSKFYFSDISPNYKYELKTSSFSAASHGDYYEFPFSVDGGIRNSMIMQNDVSRFKRVTYSYAHPCATTEICFVPYFYRPPSPSDWGFRYNTYFPFQTSPYKIRAPFKLVSYLMPNPVSDFHVGYSCQDVYDVTAGAKLLYSTAPLTVLPTDTLVVGQPEQPIYRTGARTCDLRLDSESPRWNGRVSVINSSTVSVTAGVPSYPGLFLSPGGYFVTANVPYEAYSNAPCRSRDSLINLRADSPAITLSVVPGANRLHFNFGEYYIDGIPGNATAQVAFTTTASDPNPPWIEDLQVLSDGKISGTIDPAALNTVDVAVRDQSPLSFIHLSLRLLGDTVWTPLTASGDAGSVRAQLPAHLWGGYYSMRIEAMDLGGNSVDYAIEPAFEVNGPRLSTPGRPQLLGVTANSSSFMFKWRGDTVVTSDRFQISQDPAFGATVVDAWTDRDSFEVAGQLQDSALYYWRVQSTNLMGTGGWSEPWQLSTTSVQLGLALTKGWNLVSVPFGAMQSRKKKDLFPTAISSAFAFNGSYVHSEELSSSSGYWLKFEQDESASLSGTPSMANAVPVSRGWNIVGSVSGAIPAASVLPVGTSIVSHFYGFDAGYSVADTIVPGRGYWVKVSGAGELVMNANQIVQKRTALKAPLPQINWISIADSSGRATKLYFGRANDELTQYAGYDLPPVPPGGVFDVRFASGRMVERIDGSAKRQFQILVSSPVGPLTARWNVSYDPGFVSSLRVGGRTVSMRGTGSVDFTDADSPIALETGPGDVERLPAQFSLEQNFPNPFNPSTEIRYSLPVQSRVHLNVYNGLGQRVATLVDEDQEAGIRTVRFNGNDLPSGVYFVKIQAGAFSDVRKMVLMK